MGVFSPVMLVPMAAIGFGVWLIAKLFPDNGIFTLYHPSGASTAS
jgi:hypothetical protein